ncbi:MAG: metallophosphoesterase [Planctomycetota bacterium]|nr:metallophosphoesterase [Planctomycetota bacterium]
MRILQLTDLHVFAEPGMRLKGIPTRESLSEVVQHVHDTQDRFDHVVVTGDHTHDESRAAVLAVRDLVMPWLDRLHVVPGNHDDRGVLRELLVGQGSDEGPALHFSFDGDGWRCIGLDTQSPGEVAGQLCEGELEWLDEQVASAEGLRVALFMHHPIVPVGSLWMDRIRLQDAEPLLDRIRSNPTIQLVCCGHVHREFDVPLAPHVRMVTTPSTGLQFRPEGDQATFEAAPAGYRILELSPRGLETRVVRLPTFSYVPES